jgi:type 1 glutamine amidotransferase
VEAALTPKDAHARAEPPRALEIVLVATAQDHGPGEHDYPAWQARWRALLSQSPGVHVTTAQGWPAPEHWKRAGLIVLYFWNHSWSAEQLRELDAYLARGGGLVALHSAVISDKSPESLAQRLGLASQPERTKYRHGPLDLEITAPEAHPITRGLRRVHFVDETYWPLFGDASKVDVLATAVEEGKPRPMVWTHRAGPGRVFCSVLGHYAWTYDDPLFRVMVLRGMAWAAGEPAGRFEPLATSGARLAEPR